MNRRRALVVGAKGALIVAAVALGVLLSYVVTDIYEDRSYRLVIKGPVSVYSTPEPPENETSNEILQVLKPRDEVEVRRIRYADDRIWIRVRLSDGREGYVFLNSNMELKRK